MIDWLNQNEGFVLGILTFVYVVATMVLVGVTLYQAKLTRQSIRGAAESERRRYRPHVLFDLYSEEVAVYASLRNIGSTPAYNIRLEITPELFCELRGKKRFCPLVGESISYLAPNREVKDACGFGAEFSKHFPEPDFRGLVSYEDAEGEIYQESFHINLESQRQVLRIGKKDPGKELEKIAGALQDLTSFNFKPLVRMIPEREYQSDQKKLFDKAKRKLLVQQNANEKEGSVSEQRPSEKHVNALRALWRNIFS